MVGFHNMGRCGNFLFECATSFAYSLKHGLDFTVPKHTKNPKWDPIYFPHLQNPNYNPKLPSITIQEKGHQYQVLPFQESWRHKNIMLHGYWQSQKYFEEYRTEVLQAFALPWKPHNDVSIHVRRGDYLQYPEKHPVVPHEYYKQAISAFVDLGYRTFYVFSDDIPWCKNYFDVEWPLLQFVYSEGKSEMEDLVGISNCSHHISSSSTFGWMGAWLNENPNKIIYTPKLWFVNGHNNLSTEDIVPPNWIKI